ncbi:protein TIME FOR COFFEE [Punica granatum]|uniref:Protein TIME FOR COFFEE n=1 Tax=Punica granatum TaxID=22663 RepID=A0A6P8DPM9_PUNGR|nr:protein TIME FOR COFFEE [Punica granatum]
MDRSREARRTTTMAASNGLSRRRHRTGLRDSPEEDGPVELPETARLRDRGGSGKKERDRDRDRDRERDRDRDRLSRSKRRRADRLMHGSNREDGGDDSSEESVNDEEDDDDDGGAGGSGHMRVLPPPPTGPPPSLSSSLSNQNSRRSFPPPATAAAAKVFRPVAPWKPADEMIGVSVPRKARSASTKRSHEWLSSSGHVAVGSAGEQILRQASTSPVRSSLAAMAASPVRPVSPSSSNASARKKMKANGLKPRPPKSSSKSSSSDQDEIEIEIAEVLYGMMRQPQVPPSKHEAAGTDSMRFELREESRFSGDPKSRISSPISNSPSAALPQSSSVLPQNSSSSATPMTAIAPKRKKPRPVKYDDENQPILPVRGSPIPAPSKADTDQAAKVGSTSPNLDRARGSATAENGGTPYDLATAKPVAEPEPVKPETAAVGPDSKPLPVGESEIREAGAAKEEPQSSPKKESCGLRLHDDRMDSMTATKANEIESQREEKFQIDLMAPPPSRSSQERDVDIDFAAQDPKPSISDMKTEVTLIKDDEKSMKEKANASSGEVKAESHKQALHKEKNIDLQLDLEKPTENGNATGTTSNKLNQPMHKQQQQQHSHSEKTAQPTNSLTFPMSVAGWPGGLPPMGYMTPFQGVVSMDGSAVAPAAIQPPQWLFNQPPPKKCATHFYIARNIQYHQQLTRMNPFWPAAAGSASLYGAKPNVVPSAELPGRAVTAMSEKAQNLGVFPGKDSKPSPPANSVEPSQRKQQILLQQTLPPGAPPSNILGPAFIFPLSQQHAAVAAASVRQGQGKAQNPGSSTASSGASTSTSATAAAATAMSFNYPNMPGGETQYLAILQNNAYPFPVPAHVGTAPTYRGSHAQAMPFFSGSFYSSQMLHPSQLQQQAPAPPSQMAQSGHQNSSISSGPASSQKHLQSQQQQRPLHASVGNGSLQGFPATSKGLPSQQQSQNSSSHHSRPLDHEVGAEDSPLSADTRRSNVNNYGQNFTLPLHPPNFALISAAQMAAAAQQQQQQHQQQQQQQFMGAKAAGFDSLPSQAFAMSFGSLNNLSTAPNIDISSIASNHAILQSLPEATRHSYQVYAAAAATQNALQKKNYRPSDEGKNGGNDAASEEERKTKGSTNMGQSIAFSRQDPMAEASVSLPGSNVVDSSAQTLNLGSAPVRSSGSVMPSVVNTLNSPASQQRNQQQQIMQMQKQRQFAAGAAAAARSKAPTTSSVSVCTDQQLPPFSSAAAHTAAAGKSPSALSPFPQNLVQSTTSPNQSPQWKNSPRATPGASQVPSALNSSSALKNHHQPQQGRTLQGQTQISFAAANSKGPNSPQVVGQQLPSSNLSPSPPLMVGSPTTSSMSKSTGGSPRTAAAASTGNKTNQGSTLSSQQVKSSSPSVAGHKSPAGAAAVSSILGNSHIMTSSGGQTKHQLPQQLPKQQQTQLFFAHPYVQVQQPHSTSSSAGSAATGYYHGRRSSDAKSSQQQPPQGSTATPSSSSGMLSLCSPVSLANSSTCDPVKAVAASNLKGGGLPSQGILHSAQFSAVAQSSAGPHQIVPAGFPYVHAVQVKAAEQKQPAAAREESRRTDT